MRYISIFSGIEAASVAWEPLGWQPVAFSEIDEFPSAVLRKRFPNVPNLGDITKVDWSPYRGAVDLVVGGSPCQSFSIAGKREGLAGASGLMFEYIRCVREVMPKWFIWENVPGAFSVERGQAFEQLLSELDECGYGLAWRVLDAQFFGVAQRRRRIFLVGHLGDMRACEVLFESESLRWDTPSSTDKRKELAANARNRARGAGQCVTQDGDEVSRTLTRRMDSSPSIEGRGPSIVAYGECLTPWDVQSKRIFSEDSCGPTLQAGTHESQNIQPTVLQAVSLQTGHTSGNGSNINLDDVSYTISTSNDQAVAEPIVMASGQANAEIEAGGGCSDTDGSARSPVTSNGSDVFPSLCATDGSKQFIDNQSVSGGRLLLDPRQEWV